MYGAVYGMQYLNKERLNSIRSNDLYAKIKLHTCLAKKAITANPKKKLTVHVYKKYKIYPKYPMNLCLILNLTLRWVLK